jgi:predicted histone-like DNA-binding protein
MALLYTAYQSFIASKDGKRKWHPRIIKVGNTMTSYELGVEISKRSSMSPGDALNVLDTIMDIIQQNLLNSRSVCIDRLGTFTIGCRSSGNGVDNKEEVNSKQITELKVRFTPSFSRNQYNGITYPMFEGVTFEKLEKAMIQKEEKPEEKPEEGSGGDGEGGGSIDPNA